MQHNESATLVAKRPNGMRITLEGDIRDRTFVYDGSKLVMYSPDDAVYVSIDAPGTTRELIDRLLDAGIEMPLIDVLAGAFGGTLTDQVRTGLVVGDSSVDGVACDHLAFRQATIDWQIWVEKGERAVPRKIVITTRYEVGDPQFQATMNWNLQPQIDDSTFAFVAPEGVTEISFANPAAISGAAEGDKQ